MRYAVILDHHNTLRVRSQPGDTFAPRHGETVLGVTDSERTAHRSLHAHLEACRRRPGHYRQLQKGKTHAQAL